MTCTYCNGNYENDITTYVIDISERIIIIRNVPCLKCDQCGQVSYTGTVFERLEQIVDTLKDSITEVAIVKYSDTAA